MNVERTTLRRPPQQITSITPLFDENAFNFNKIRFDEILFEYEHPKVKTLVTWIINNSPVTMYHAMICPALKENRPQVLTSDAITIAIDILMAFDDKNFWIGYNSPGALASVNHLHLHLYYKEYELMIDGQVRKRAERVNQRCNYTVNRRWHKKLRIADFLRRTFVDLFSSDCI